MNLNKSSFLLRRKKRMQNNNNIPELNIPISIIRGNKRKMTISPRKKKLNQLSDNSFFINRKKISNKFRNRKARYSFYNKKIYISSVERQSPKASKRKSLEILPTKTKHFYKRYSLEKKSFYNNNYNSNCNKRANNNNIHLLDQSMENNLRKTLIIMKTEFEKKMKIDENKKTPKKYNKLCSSPDLNKLINVKKINGRLSLCPIIDKQIIKKRNNSFDFSEKFSQKLRKRIRNDINEKIINENMLKRIDEVVESDSENENLKVKNKNLSFSPNSTFIFIFDLLLIISNIFSFIFIPLNIARNENIINKESYLIEIIKYLNDIIYLFDFFITLFRGYYNYEIKLIRDNNSIFIHYLKQDFFIDLIEGIPVYIIIRLSHKNNETIHFGYFDLKMFLLKLLLFIKSFKIFKLFIINLNL